MLNETTATISPDDDHSRVADTPAPRRRGRAKGKLNRSGEGEADIALRSLLSWEDSVVCWTPVWAASTHRSTVGQVAVFRLADRRTAAAVEAFACHGGGVEVTTHGLTPRKTQTEALRLFNKLILEDAMRPRVVHEAMLALRPYVLAIDDAIPGARRTPGPVRKRNGDDFAPQVARTDT